jgi:Tfp pilus assembly protein PilX
MKTLRYWEVAAHYVAGQSSGLSTLLGTDTLLAHWVSGLGGHVSTSGEHLQSERGFGGSCMTDFGSLSSLAPSLSIIRLTADLHGCAIFDVLDFGADMSQSSSIMLGTYALESLQV